MRLQTSLIALSIFVTCFHSVSGHENGEETPQTIENPSPDGRFAFRNTGDSDSEKQTYDLIDKAKLNCRSFPRISRKRSSEGKVFRMSLS